MLNYTLLAIKDKDKVIAGKREIQLSHIRQYVYGIPFSLSIYSTQNLELSMNKKYKIFFEGLDIDLHLLNKNHEKVSGVEYNVFTFAHKDFVDISLVKKKTESNIQDLILDLVEERGKQLKRLSFSLRKKALFWTLNDKLNHSLTTFQNATSKEAKKPNLKLVSINAVNKRRENFYCLEDGEKYKRTIKGVGDPIFLPFAKEKDISNLDNFLIPTHKAITELTNLKIGDIIKIEEKKRVVLEIEIFFADNIKSYIIVGNTC